jgi:hypothetical protein
MVVIAVDKETGVIAVFGPVYTASGATLMRQVIEKRGGWTVSLTCPLISKTELMKLAGEAKAHRDHCPEPAPSPDREDSR